MPIQLLWIVATLVIVGVLLWALGQFPIDPTIAKVIRVVVIVVVVIWVVYLLMGMLPLTPVHRLR